MEELPGMLGTAERLLLVYLHNQRSDYQMCCALCCLLAGQLWQSLSGACGRPAKRHP
jgi:hypothetical protein